MNEAETRAEYIDPALAAAGWGVVDGSRVRREYPITLGRIEGAGKRGKALTADYVLEYRNTKLAVVEAKAWDKALTEGVGQAKDYAQKLSLRYTYATNGQGIYGIDMQTGVGRNCRRSQRQKPCGKRLLPPRMPGATASPPCPSRTRAVTGRAVTIRTLPSSACWRRWPRGAIASC